MDRNEPLSEDCLMLNVWTPAVGAGKRPVMVWLHGGGFTERLRRLHLLRRRQAGGASTTSCASPSITASTCSATSIWPGSAVRSARTRPNVGKLDIVAALEWVRDNIAAFGGDPSQRHAVRSVGRRGQGELADGDAGGERPVPQGHRSERRGREGHDEGCGEQERRGRPHAPQPDRRSRLDELQKVPMQKLLDLQEPAAGAPIGFAPVTDGKTLPVDPFDPVAPAQSADIPLLIGTTETRSRSSRARCSIRSTMPRFKKRREAAHAHHPRCEGG